MASKNYIIKFLERIPSWGYILISFVVVVTAGFIEYQMGRQWICQCGYVKLWEGIVNSSGNSQHLADWYTFSHIIHGLLFYWFFRTVSRKKLPVLACLVLSLVLESAWEVLENTDLIINRYREATISLEYYGDSILNSIADILWTGVGFFLASRLRVSLSIILVIILELWVGYLIHDNLFLNIVMLVYPLDVIKDWQMLG